MDLQKLPRLKLKAAALNAQTASYKSSSIHKHTLEPKQSVNTQTGRAEPTQGPASDFRALSGLICPGCSLLARLLSCVFHIKQVKTKSKHQVVQLQRTAKIFLKYTKNTD